jgi:hypothetical protein
MLARTYGVTLNMNNSRGGVEVSVATSLNRGYLVCVWLRSRVKWSGSILVCEN